MQMMRVNELVGMKKTYRVSGILCEMSLILKMLEIFVCLLDIIFFFNVKVLFCN